MVPRHRIVLGILTVRVGLARTCDAPCSAVVRYCHVPDFLTFIDMLALALSIPHFCNWRRRFFLGFRGIFIPGTATRSETICFSFHIFCNGVCSSSSSLRIYPYSSLFSIVDAIHWTMRQISE